MDRRFDTSSTNRVILIRTNSVSVDIDKEAILLKIQTPF
jgi:hypothetical protein